MGKSDDDRLLRDLDEAVFLFLPSSPAQLARQLTGGRKVKTQLVAQIEAHLAAGAPVGADGRIRPLDYLKWLILSHKS
jgi:hypothetical protein